MGLGGEQKVWKDLPWSWLRLKGLTHPHPTPTSYLYFLQQQPTLLALFPPSLTSAPPQVQATAGIVLRKSVLQTSSHSYHLHFGGASYHLPLPPLPGGLSSLSQSMQRGMSE